MISGRSSRFARACETTSRDCWPRTSGLGPKAMANPYNEPLFDLLSFARPGPGRRDRLSSTDIPQIARTVGRTPEVMVKVLSRSASDLNTVRKHLEYIGRKGEVDLETDSGEKAKLAEDILDDWDLELDEYRSGADLSATDRKRPPRLV